MALVPALVARLALEMLDLIGSAHIGTYSVVEAEKTLVFHVEGNTFPNQEGVDTKRFITINGDEFKWTTPNPSVGGTSEAVWRRVR